jgi:hypothetical protein
MLLRLIRQMRRKPPAEVDLRKFGRDVREVMWGRISRAMAGTLSADEAHRMVAEKQSAAVRAQLAYMRALLDGAAADANRAAFDIYHQAVQSNRKRLGKRRRWRWLGASAKHEV